MTPLKGESVAYVTIRNRGGVKMLCISMLYVLWLVGELHLHAILSAKIRIFFCILRFA